MEKIFKAKKLQKSEIDIKDWSRNRGFCSDFIEKCFLWEESVERRDFSLLSVDEFRMGYELANRPLVIENLVKKWPAFEKWSFQLKCGETDRGDPIKLKIKHFISYLSNQIDDYPLYVFDENFEKACPDLSNDYSVPVYFPQDLFFGTKKRPPFKWLLIGPKRSGSSVHQDPLGTSAWNASISGYKLWVLFPPNTSKSIVEGKKLKKNSESYEAFWWFKNFLPKIKEKYGISPFVIVQRPGDLVFVPSKWWHAVLNLTDTLAVTHNYVSGCNFDSVYRCVKKQRKKFFERWKETLFNRYFFLWKRGKLIDDSDFS